MRRQRFEGAGTLEALHALDDVVTRTVEVDRPILLLAIDRAERFGLSVHDAAYVSLAESLDAELATMDRVLAAAAGDRAVSPGDHRRRLSETPASHSPPPRVTWPDYADAASYLAALRADLRRGTSRA